MLLPDPSEAWRFAHAILTDTMPLEPGERSAGTSTGGQRSEREVAFFDEFASTRGDYDVLSDRAYRRLRKLFEHLVQPKPGERCIDLGCGTGAFTRRLRGLDLQLEGMDISPVSVAAANRSAQGERYICGDITRTGLPDERFDIILYSGVLHHFDSPMARALVLREGRRLIAPGGRLFAYDPNARSPSMWLYRDPRSPLFSQVGKTENEVLLSRRELENELRESGWDDIEVQGVSGMTFRFVEGGVARRMLPLYNLYEWMVRLSPVERWIGTFVVSFARRSR